MKESTKAEVLVEMRKIALTRLDHATVQEKYYTEQKAKAEAEVFRLEMAMLAVGVDVDSLKAEDEV